MAEELKPFNFSIENTMEMGAGKEMIEDFLSDVVTTPAEKVEEIKEEKKKPVPKAPIEPKGKVKEEEEKIDPPKPDANKVINDFFGEEGKTEEDNEEVIPQETPKDGEGTKFNALAKDCFKLGVFTKFDEEEDEAGINTPEEFLDRMNFEKKNGAIDMVNKFIGQFGEDYQAAFEAIYVKGVDPKEYFGTYNTIQDFATLDLKDEGNQIAVLKQGLLDQGFETEDITAEIERIRNSGDLETTAQRNHRALVKKEAAKMARLEKDSEEKVKQQTAVKNQYVTNVNNVLQEKLKAKEFDGIPLNPKLASELQDFLLVDRYKTPSGETLTEFDKSILELKRPENHAKKVKIGLLLKILEKDPTLSTIQKTGITTKSNQLFGELARQTGKSSVKTSKEKEEKENQPTSWFV